MRRLSMPRAQRPCRPTPSRAWLGLVVLVLLDPGCSGSAGADKDAAADLTADADKDAAADLTADAGPEIEVTPDAGPDLVPEVADAVAEVPAPTGQAWAFLQDPTENDGKPTKVVLPWVSAPDGTLTGPYAKVYNCLKQPGGVRVPFDYEGMDLFVDLCVERQTVIPDAEGNYLYIGLPKDMASANDAFAEIMAYYHINRIHDYFRFVHGYEYVDHSLFSLVNFQVSPLGVDWFPIDNAAFLPEGSMDELGVKFTYDEDLIVFGQGQEIDYAYDADVIYHEYAHYAIGGERLFGYTADERGLDSSPLGINEGLADYFPSSVSGDPVLGKYSLGGSARNLEEYRRCPEDILGEAHWDGQIVSSALWRLRKKIGPPRADAIVFSAMQAAGKFTTMPQFSELLVEAAKVLHPEVAGTVEDVMEFHGLAGCERVVALDGDMGTLGAQYVQGTATSGLTEFHALVPGPLQLVAQVREGTHGLAVEADVEVAGMSAFLYPGGAVDVKLAVRRDTPVTYTYDPHAEMAADQVVSAEKIGDKRRRYVVGSKEGVAAGTYYFQFVSYSFPEVMVSKITYRALND